MKKILFNDKFQLTKAVLDGRKTQTRRLATPFLPDAVNTGFSRLEIAFGRELRCWNKANDFIIYKIPYKVNEVVAVAQSYCSIADELENCNNATCAVHYEKNIQKASEYISWMEHPGFNNKLFVAADRMIHKIRITDVHIEKLKDIQEEDCLKEGIIKGRCGSENTHFMDAYYIPNDIQPYCTPCGAFAHLINKVSKKDVWSENPYVFVYDFELVK